jgi:hypothetical protein
VLDTVIRLLNEGSFAVTVRDIAEATGFDPKDVDRALNALSEAAQPAEARPALRGGTTAA